MQRALSAALLALLFLFFLTDRAVAQTSADDDGWHERFLLRSTMLLGGYRNGRIVEDDSAFFTARDDHSALLHFEADWTGRWGWAELQIAPYTLVPQQKLRVNLAGVQAYLRFPVTDFLWLGMYHHSTHNFNSEGTERYGTGAELDGLVLRLRPVAGTGRFLKRFGGYEWTIEGFWAYPFAVSRNFSPFVVTEDAAFSYRGTGYTAWHLDSKTSGTHPLGSAGLNAHLTGTPSFTASLQLEADALLRLGALLPGPLADRLFLGPAGGYGRNLERQETMGTDQWWFGIRLNLVSSDDDDPLLR